MYKSFIIYKNTLYYSGLTLNDLADYLSIDASNYERGRVVYKGNRPHGTYYIFSTAKASQYDFQKLFNNKVCYEVSLESVKQDCVITQTKYVLGSYSPPNIHKERL